MAMMGAAQKSPEAFRTISEVADWLDVPQHVLRFWETKFGAVKPMKRGGGRRYYRPDDVDLLRGIRTLLYGNGLTIKGVQKILKEQGPRYVMDVGRGASLIPTLRAVGADTPQPVMDAHIPPLATLHTFPREDESEPESEPASGLTRSERARFTTLLDELTDLKVRLRAARRSAS